MVGLVDVNVKERIKAFRDPILTTLRTILAQPLPFKIPVLNSKYVNLYPHVFELGHSVEYKASVDCFLDHILLSLTSEQAVVVLDGMWQNVLKSIADVLIYLDEHDPTSLALRRPDFSALHLDALVMKGEAKASLQAMVASRHDLTKKFRRDAYKMFPSGCTEIPAITTCNEEIHLFGISYFDRQYILDSLRVYRVIEIEGRVAFIEDLFKLMIWILSQSEPVERFHLVPERRMRTPNGHHVTLLQDGLLKEFSSSSQARINMDVIREIYRLHLENVEWGSVNCTSISITRVGRKLKDVFRLRNMDRTNVVQQVELGVSQLHANSIAHCDLCLDNIFVDNVEDGGRVFLGDVEYCCAIESPAPTDLRRSDRRARTAGDLDSLQLEKLKDELASLL